MLLDLNHLMEKYSMNIKGVIQVGAHWGQEYLYYRRKGIDHIVFIEPCKDAFSRLVDSFGTSKIVTLFNVACGEGVGEMQMYTEHTNQGQSNSLLPPKLHLEQHKEVVFDSQETVTVVALDNLPIEVKDYNFLNMDCQGYEDRVLKGAVNTLKNIDYVYTEVNRAEMYLGCCMVADLDTILCDFERVETGWASDHHGWGDALYLRKSLLTY